ncbi:protein VACUOLELESS GAMETOPHYTES-like [Tasmannia lanceolata]|uniref:protein VACUOLELESS GAMETOPHYTES-like n=1 Tax=Tasmannia lanceolata TaxID=3420 RepID=UPI0040642350
MGKLSYEPQIQHFSHQHPLELTTLPHTQITSPLCFGCNLKLSGWLYTCKPCNYYLHISCSQLPHLIQHPADPNHALSLLPYPAYPEGYFNCDACGRRGDGFSYHCGRCNFDVHILCASMPLSINHQAHCHTLNLAFFPPYQNKGFSCDICKRLGSNHWLYRCETCEFDAHLGCATAKTMPLADVQIQQLQVIQQQRMLPLATPQFQAGVGFMNGSQQRYSPNYYMNNPSPGAQEPIRPLTERPGLGNRLMDQATEGFVDGGGTEKIGQSLVQSVIEGGGGGGGGDSSSSTLFLDMGSSNFSSAFGASNLSMSDD